jgi:hypothetical protein
MVIADNSSLIHPLKPYITERRWVIVFAITVMFFTTLPYFLGYWVETNDPQYTWRFTGFIFGVEDGNSYIAKALTGAFGAWLFRTPYTVIPQNGIIAFLPYLLIGKLVSDPGMHEQLVALFHWFRFIAGGLSILATYDFIDYFVNNKKLSRFGLVIAVLGGGLGWMILLFGKSAILGSLPLEFYSPEAFGFLGIYGLPHVAMARALLFWGLLLHFRVTQDPGSAYYKKSLIIGVLWLLIALLQPITAFIMGMILGLHLIIVSVPIYLFSHKNIGRDYSKVGVNIKIFVLELIPILPFFIYYVYSYATDSFLKIWSAQNTITSPHPIHYLLAYGVLLPLAIFGAYSSYKQKNGEGYVLTGWLILAAALAYAPISIQRRLVDGIWVVWVVLSVLGYQWLEKNRPSMKLRWSLPLILFVTIPSTLILLIGGISTALSPSEPIFRPNSEIAAFQFLGGVVQPNDIVLASYETGNVLPAWAPVRVLIGHGPESADLENYSRQVKTFFAIESSDLERQALISQYGVRFIFWGPHEQALGGWDPGQASWLSQIFNLHGYVIFEVVNP